MAKRKSTRETQSMIQTALWLPRDMHERLKAEGGDRGLGDEIRRRLQLTVDNEGRASDPVTDLLVELIREIASRLDARPHWHEDRWASETLAAAAKEIVLSLCPRDRGPLPALEPERKAALQNKYGPDITPDVVGPMLARTALVQHATEQLRKRALG